MPCFRHGRHHERVAREPVPLERKQQVSDASPIQRRLGVEEMVSVIVFHLWRGSPLDEFVRPVSAKAVSSLHADGQFGRKHAQVGADLTVENLSKLEIVEFAQSPCEHAAYQQRRREPLRWFAGAHPRPLLLDEFLDRHGIEYTDEILNLATCKSLIFKRLQVAVFCFSSVYFRRREKRKMCEIGKPLEILDVEPLVLPAPLHKEKERPTERPVTVEVPVAETKTTVELSLVEKL